VEDRPLTWVAGDHRVDRWGRTLVMGVLNVTPDSFSDGGRFIRPAAAVVAGVQMVEDGADILDVGGESTRPGADPVDEDVEAGRVLPVIQRLAAEVAVPISVDTRKAGVARRALEAGASIVNDVSGGGDGTMFEVARAAGAGLVLMHMRGEPRTMQQHTEYVDVVADVERELRARLDAAVEAGVEPEHLAVDPGLGFAKTAGQSLLLMQQVAVFRGLGRPVLVGPSRKSFIGRLLGVDVDERLEGTAGAVAWLAASGAHIVRVHDVKEMVRVIRVVDGIRAAAPGVEPG
jgi:dihydropteroate synthase